MRWFQINQESPIFNLANITHFETIQYSNKWHVVAYFNFIKDDGHNADGLTFSQYNRDVGFSAKKRKASEQVIKDIINGKYDVTQAGSTPKQ